MMKTKIHHLHLINYFLLFLLFVIPVSSCRNNVHCDACIGGVVELKLNDDPVNGFTKEERDSMYIVLHVPYYNIKDSFAFTNQYQIRNLDNNYPHKFEIKNKLNNSIYFNIDSLSATINPPPPKSKCGCGTIESVYLRINNTSHTLGNNETFIVSRQ
ncbi:MAG: hypothetical protein ACK40G_02185 [Cytophagaceae bacterium]